MRAHKQKVHVEADHHLEIVLPDDFPSGPAEVIVLAASSGEDTARALLRELRPHPTLGKIVFHEDPALPLEPEDWPEE